MFCMRHHPCRRREKCTLCGNSVVRPPEATAQPVSEPESESAPAPETPTEPAVEDISSNSTEASKRNRHRRLKMPLQDGPDDEYLQPFPADFTEDISSGDALGDKPEGIEHEGTFTVSPTPEEISGPEPRVQPIEYTYNDGYAYEEYDEKPKKKRSFKWLFIVLAILIAIGATIGGIFWWYNAPMQKLTRALDAYDYSAAAQVLPTLSKDELASVSDQMQEYAQTVIDRYNKSEANYDSSYELLDRLQKLFPNIGLDDQLDGIQSLKDSKEAYKNGKSLQATGRRRPRHYGISEGHSRRCKPRRRADANSKHPYRVQRKSVKRCAEPRGRERFPRCRSHFDEQRRYPRR
ncbi:hypothetical protein [Hominenteromicrobium sp.]|uniref:hypothetical protein n=1 Tax=Hominenteromicrobium sp. TaxID=3073581 RepID=UPI00399B8C86